MVALSSTDIDSKVSGTWKVRARPSRARSSGGFFETSWPAKETMPEVSGRSPVRQLKKVDLPAPLGPIRPRMSPSSTDTEASSTALKAPNALVTFLASISTAHLAAFEQREEPARQEAGDDHDDRTIDHEGDAGTLATQQAVAELLERHQDQGADQRPEQLP